MTPTDAFTVTPPYNVVQPGAYSAVNSSLISEPNLNPGAPIPVAIGTTLGGAPDKALYFSSPSQLLQALRGGPAYDLARFMFDGGAPQVGVVRVGNTITQASLTLAGTTGNVITLTAKDYGSWCNAITVAVTAGPIISLQYTNSLGEVFTEQWNFTGVTGLTLAQIVSAINGGLYGYAASNYVTASLVTVSPGTLPLINASAAPLTGGTDGTAPAAGDWTNGLTALQTEPVDIIVPATGDATVHAQVLAHCVQMSSSAARMERTCELGGVLGETVTQAIARQAALVNARENLSYPGFYDYNAQGVITLYDPFYLAGKKAGMRAALPDPATSLVHASVPIIAAEVDLSTVPGGAIDQLLAGGVSPVVKRHGGGGYWIVDDITGYNLPDDIFRDVDSVRSADYVAQYLRNGLEAQFVGGKGLATTESSITQVTTKLLDDLVTQQIIAAFLAPTVSSGPGLNGWSVTAPVQLVNTIKYIFITEQLQPSSTVTGSTSANDTV